MSETPRIRLAKPSDVHVLADIEKSSFSDPWPASAFTDVMLMPSATALIAVDENDVPMGYCVLLTAADQGEVANIAVACGARRQGLAAALLREATAHATARGVADLFLEVRASNVAALALYRSFGYQEIGRRPGYYQRPTEDALVLQWSATGTTEMVM